MISFIIKINKQSTEMPDLYLPVILICILIAVSYLLAKIIAPKVYQILKKIFFSGGLKNLERKTVVELVKNNNI